jgi:MFS family permease
VIIIILNMLPMMAIVALMPVVPAIRNNFKDVPNISTLAPMVLAAPGLCVALFSPFAGFLTDKLGRRKLLLLFTLLYGFGGVLPFFIVSFPILLGGRLALGIGEAFILTIGNTLLGDYFNPTERTKWLMWQGIFGSLSGTLLLSFTGYLSTIRWNFPFLLYSIAFLVSIGVFLVIYEPHEKKQEIVERKLNENKFPVAMMVRISLFTLLASTLYFVYTLHFSLALDSMGIKDGQKIGNYSALASIAVPFGAILFKLVSKKDTRIQFAVLFFLVGLGLIFIGSSINVQTVIAGAWIQQLGGGMAVPVLIAWSLRKVPAEFRGRGMGFWTSGFFLGQFISPLVVSAVKSVTGDLLVAFIVFGVICLVIAGTNMFLSKKGNVAVQ